MVGQPGLEIDLRRSLRARSSPISSIYRWRRRCWRRRKSRGLARRRRARNVAASGGARLRTLVRRSPLVTPELRALIEDDILRSAQGRISDCRRTDRLDRDGEIHRRRHIRGGGRARVRLGCGRPCPLQRADEAQSIEAAFPGVLVEGAIDRDRLGATRAGRQRRAGAAGRRRSSDGRQSAAGIPGARATAQGRRLVVVDIPLLFESGGENRSTSSSSSAHRKLCKRRARSPEKA